MRAIKAFLLPSFCAGSRLGDQPAAAEHLPLAARLPPQQRHVLPCAAGKAKEGKKSPCPPGQGRNAGAQAGCATGCMQCSWQCWAGRGVSASLWQRQNCTAGTLFPTKFPNWGNLGPRQCQSRRGVSPWCRKQTCLACHFFSLLWIETSTAPLAPASCEGSPQSATRRRNPARGGTTTPHTHRKAQGLERGLA